MKVNVQILSDGGFWSISFQVFFFLFYIFIFYMIYFTDKSLCNICFFRNILDTKKETMQNDGFLKSVQQKYRTYEFNGV